MAICSKSVWKIGYALLTSHQEGTSFVLLLQAAGRFAFLHHIAGTLLGCSSASTRARFRPYLCLRLYAPLGACDFVALKGPGISILVRITCQGKITLWKIYTRIFFGYLPQRPQCEKCPWIAAKADEMVPVAGIKQSKVDRCQTRTTTTKKTQ